MTTPIATSDAVSPIVPPKFGLLSVAGEITDAPRWEIAGVSFTPTPRPSGTLIAAECTPGPTDPPLEFRDGRPSADSAPPFVVYAGFTCKLPGLTIDEVNDEAQRTLQASVVPELEAKAWELFAADVVEPFGTDAVSPAVGVGLLEQWLEQEYAGAGAIHAPRRLGAVLGANRVVFRDGDVQRTQLDTPVAFGNYPETGAAGAAAGAGNVWLIATGRVLTASSQVRVRSAEALFDRTTNIVTGVASQAWALTFDDVAAAIKITVEGS